MEVTLELRPHKGMMGTPLGNVEVRHNQDMVFVSTSEAPEPKLMGYIGHKSKANPKPPFNGLTTFRDLPEELKGIIVAKLTEKVGYDPSIFQPTVLSFADIDGPEEEYDDDDDDEEIEVEVVDEE